MERRTPVGFSDSWFISLLFVLFRVFFGAGGVTPIPSKKIKSQKSIRREEKYISFQPLFRLLCSITAIIMYLRNTVRSTSCDDVRTL